MPARRDLGLPLAHPATLVATWFGCGLVPWAPGTWGSLAALPFAWGIALVAGGPGLLAAAALLFPVGWWAARRVTRGGGVADPGSVVVDEVVGQWLAVTVVPPDPIAYAAGFLLFRAFDILKPWPVGWADRRLKGGFGIMADDVIAGIYAGAILAVGRYLIG
jgi:phosphatidylglycerophosphatase A